MLIKHGSDVHGETEKHSEEIFRYLKTFLLELKTLWVGIPFCCIQIQCIKFRKFLNIRNLLISFQVNTTIIIFADISLNVLKMVHFICIYFFIVKSITSFSTLVFSLIFFSFYLNFVFIKHLTLKALYLQTLINFIK